MGRARLLYLHSRPDLDAAGSPGGEYWHRPGELLVHHDDVGPVRAALEGSGLAPAGPEHDRRRDEQRGTAPAADADEVADAAERLGVVRFAADLAAAQRLDVGAMAKLLRAAGDPGRKVSPNHVLMGEPFYNGGPVDNPTPADRLESGTTSQAGSGIQVGVLDTGLVRKPRPAGQFMLDPGRDSEVEDADGDGVLDDQAGHGTFVSGMVLQEAPGAEVHIGRVLDSFGVADELTIAAGILRLAHVDVLNLSLGGYSEHNLPPLALWQALEALDRGSVVVAAAGNDGRARPIWPAAFTPVVAVGAVDTDGDGRPCRAGFSNHGPWVDACARGTNCHSNFVNHNGPLFGSPDVDEFTGWAYWSGTSFAAPTVAGRIAATAQPGQARRAAFELLNDPDSPRLPGLGTVIT